MRYSVLLLCIALGIFAFVDASVVEGRAELLQKRQRGGNGQCKSNAPAPAPAANSVSAASPSDTVANSGKVANPGGRNGGKGKGGAGAGTGAGAANATTAAAAAAAATTGAGNGGAAANNAGTGTTNAASSCLDANAIQTGSQNDGQATPVAGQVASLTDADNFINFCATKGTLTNGLQVIGGSCNGIPAGQIPAKGQMPSSMITFPGHNQDIPPNQTFNITSTLINLSAGFFTNAQLTYYSAPTQLDGKGLIVGHTHVTVQNLGGSFNPTQPLDSSVFVFFKGINGAQDANNQLSATVTGGLPAGFYRVCTMVGNANHSPLQMPVAQRGGQDDCKYFSVGQGTGNAGAGANSNGAAATTAAAAGATATNAAAGAGKGAVAANNATAATGKTGGKGGKGNKGGRRQRIM